MSYLEISQSKVYNMGFVLHQDKAKGGTLVILLTTCPRVYVTFPTNLDGAECVTW